MLSDVMRFAINVLLPVALIIGWLIAEFRCRTTIRVSLGLLCLLFPLLWSCAVIYSTDVVICLQRVNLHRIGLMVQEGEEKQVLRALRVYETTYETTQSDKMAAFQLNADLMVHRGETNANPAPAK